MSYNVTLEKQQLTAEHISILLNILSVLLGRPATETDYRTLIRECGLTGIAQSELSPLLREERNSFDGSPTARLFELAQILPEEIVLPITASLDHVLGALMRAKHSEKKAVAEEMRSLQAEHDQECKLLRDEVRSISDERDKLSQSLEEVNETNRTQLERVNQLDREKTLLEGRLQEREAAAKVAKANAKDGKAKPRKKLTASVHSSDQPDSATEADADAAA